MDITITAIETIGLRIPFDTWSPPHVAYGVARTHIECLYVRVTASNGIVGWGEAQGGARHMAVAAFDHWIRRSAIGQSVADETLIPRLQRMYMSLMRGGPMLAALSGLDIALWDIRGKIEGLPVSTLLGGAKRAHLDCYASLMQYDANPEYLKRNTARALERGFRQVKLHEKKVEAVAVAREAIGPDIPLMVDTNCAWTTLAEATAAVNGMKAYNPLWIEEPLYPPEDFESLAGLRKATGVAMAAGENIVSPYDFRRMASMGAADYLQPSIAKVGGITGMMQVAAAIEGAGASCTPNVFYMGPGYLAVIHCLAAKERPSTLEQMFFEMAARPFAKAVFPIDGKIEVPRGPGLGADPEDELIARFRV